MKQYRPLAFLLIMLLSLSACRPGEEAEEAQTSTSESSQEKIVNVKTLRLRPQSFTKEIELRGTVAPWKSVNISSELSGQLEYSSLAEGKTVNRGEVVARVNARLLSAQKEQAEANYRLNNLQEKWQKQILAKQVAVAEEGYANNASTFARQQQLYQDEVISAQAYDNSETNLSNSKLQLELQKLQRESGVAVNRQQTVAAGANLKVASANLAKAIVTSPISGYVNQLNVEQGEIVSPGTPIAQVVQINPVKVELGVPESDIGSISQGQQMEVRLDTMPDTPLLATVSFIAAAADNDSRTFPVKLRLDNPNYKIRGGMIARVTLERPSESEVIVVPQDAVMDARSGRYVFVEEDGRAVKRAVTIGRTQRGNVVINSGLESGEQLIVVGQRSVNDRDKVNVQETRIQRPGATGGSANPEVQPAPTPSASASADPGASSSPSSSANPQASASAHSAAPSTANEGTGNGNGSGAE